MADSGGGRVSDCLDRDVVGLRAVPRQGVRHHCIRQVLADFDSGGGGRWLRLPYTLAVAKFGGRNWTVISALLLLIQTT